MERSIDHHESQRPPGQTSVGLNRVTKWRDAWTACFTVVEGYSSSNLKSFHLVFGQWVSILNWIFGNPIRPLRRMFPIFIIARNPMVPKKFCTCTWIPMLEKIKQKNFTVVLQQFDPYILLD
ncbi:uncharacterized protein TNCT_58531 [Trichonephila clavata]|uniref:Uncharacterized protein n=1 Tax=Trichonephila clavata TaxID=2740835 RepID=A0A8X6M4I5_TRICU|nr:uncharacterized protein TNCT_58531 [Trichonephila clavata]